uniref:TSC22 domain family protein 1-like n=1 Tax=Steinernema glaseri TaxID=37863 RepID=A0A1I7YTV0_9BILA
MASVAQFRIATPVPLRPFSLIPERTCRTPPPAMPPSAIPLHLARFSPSPQVIRRRHSLAPDSAQPRQPPNNLLRSRRSVVFSPSSNPSGPNSQIVAIDHKIEQAMDLVKTHLMFAVREEVDVLRSRIMELETTVIQLEAENAILREHVPEEILAKMNMQSSV